MIGLKMYLLSSATLLFCIETGESSVEVQNLNTMVDALIGSALQFIKQANYATMVVPDLEKSFQNHFLFIPITGGMKAVGGVFQDLATLERTGDATLSIDEDEKKLRVFLGLGTMELQFTHCSVWLGKISISEGLHVKVGKNSVDIEVSVINDGKTCTSKLDHIKINDIGDFDVAVSGLGVLNRMIGNIERWTLDHFENVITTLVEEKLSEQVSKALEKFDLCEML